MLSKIKKIDYRHYIAIGIFLILIGYSLIFRINIYSRIWRSLVYFGVNIVNLFKFSDIKTDINPPNLNLDGYSLPFSFKSLVYDFKMISISLFNKDFAFNYTISVIDLVIRLLKFIIYIPLIVLIIYFLTKIILKEGKEEDDQESKALVKYKNFELKVIAPIKQWFKDFKNFLNHFYYYKVIYIVFFLILFRIIPVTIDLFSTYLFILKTFNFEIIFKLLTSITIDILVILLTYNKIVLMLVGIYIIAKLRHYYGRKKLEKMQKVNEKAAADLAVATLVTGPVGSGKTMMMTSMAIDIEMQFRFQAFEIIKKYHNMFPKFPFDKFEEWIISGFQNGEIVNRAQIKTHIKDIFNEFLENPSPDLIWGYDYEENSLLFHNGIRYIELPEALIEYGQAYYLYWVDKPLSFTNYSIRHQYIRDGYFPQYDYDYINAPKDCMFKGQFSSIANFDTRRILNRVDQFDPSKWYLMDGQIEAYTEIDKERGNRDDHIGLDKKSSDANQRNDGFNKSIKVTRHEFTIDSQPFTKILFDSQREFSVNADLRESCEDRIRIKSRSKNLNISLPFIWIDYMICEPLVSRFEEYYYTFRSKRKDKTLYNYLLMKLIMPFYRHFTKLSNLYGYQIVHYRQEQGATATEAGKKSDKLYYFISQKMFANRYSTDCYSAFFDSERIKANKGFLQAEQYDSTKASVAELSEQNSYWIDEIKAFTSLDVISPNDQIIYKDND